MKARKGFTLVELLIVIVIIGILAAAMLLSSVSATDSAEASNIISDLRGLKTAALMLFADSMDDFSNKVYGPPPAQPVDIGMLTRYVADPAKYGYGGAYSFEVNVLNGETKWWVGFNMTTGNKGPSIGEKLTGKAKSIGLYKDMAYTFFDDKTDTEVWMAVR